MSTTIIALKLTNEELDVLDWVVYETSNVSRSDALRECLLQQASMIGVQYGAIAQARDSRLNHPVRTSKHKRKRIRPVPLIEVLAGPFGTDAKDQQEKTKRKTTRGK